MPTPQVSEDLLIQSLNWAEQYGSGHLASKAGVGVAAATINSRINVARLKGLRPTFQKEAPRIHTQHRLGRMHIVIPDCQVSPGVRTDHLEWVGNYIVEKKPDVIINIGDFADMPSLSSYDKGKMSAEGRRYNKDVDASRKAMERLLKPIDDYNRTATEKYTPRKVFTTGNHEERANRFAEQNPEMDGKVGANDLGFEDWGWEVYPFLRVVKVDGIEYCHYFTSGAMGRPASSAAVVLRERQCSATMGHVQHTDIAMHKKTQQIALFAGTCYLHDERYLGHQGNSQRRQIIVKHEVEDGRYDPMFVSLKFLEKAYA